MKTFPLDSITLEEAKQLQFHAIDCVTLEFDGKEILSTGDLGVVKGLNKPIYTKKAEKVFARFFGASAALFVRGSGTGAIRWGLIGTVKPGGTLLLHRAPIYPTTKVTMESAALNALYADFNDPADIERVIRENQKIISGSLIQHTRQKPDDSYELEKVIRQIKRLLPGVPVVTDDNYAALKVRKIGCQAGADLSAFSSFKILGPEGVGVLVGDERYIERVESLQYSGGSQVQGHEAMQALQGLIYAPVSLAIQAQVNAELLTRLLAGEVPGVKNAFSANAQSNVLLVEFEREIVSRVLELCVRYGAAPHPVGCESKYEFVPLIYRVSGTFREQDPSLEKRMIRINPLRSGPDTIIRILKRVMEEIGETQYSRLS
jgi:hypothetical protein